MEYTKIDYDKLLELFEARRQEKGLSITSLSEMSGISPRTLTYILRGYRRIQPERLQGIFSALEISDAEVPSLTGVTTKAKGKHIFISYSHRDSEYLERLMVHLRPLEKQGLIDPWVDTRLLAGDRWKKEIDKALKSAKVAILLISADFLASNFIIENELPPLLQAAENSGTLIIPVILKPCRFTRDKNLRDFQSINPPDEPLSLIDENERELIYDSIAQRIESVFE